MSRLPILTAALSLSTLLNSQVIGKSDSDLILHSRTQEVLLDFVARDKHQKVIADLRSEEVQVYEDGVLQHLHSFRYSVGDSKNVPSVEQAKANRYDPLRELNVISVVFEGMSAQSRQHSAQYALEFLGESLGPNTWAGIFTLSHRLSVVQPYTNNLPLLRHAVQRAATGTYEAFAKESTDRLERINSLQAAKASARSKFQPISPGSAEERGPAGGLGDAAQRLAALEKLTLRALYQQSGSRTIDGLRDLVRAQALLPGRKTILYFSEGLVIPPDQPELLADVIGEANRANVTFYTLDARGLQLTSGTALAQAASSAVNIDPSGSSDPGAAIPHTDLESNARELAAGTGGFAMDNSNDFRAPLRRVMEDVNTHYEVTYTPQAGVLDGHFRKVDIKILRSGLKIQSRKGYFAVPLVNGESFSLSDIAALRALDTSLAPHAFDFEFAALNLGPNAEGTQYAMTFAIPSRSIHFNEDAATDSFRVHVACMALIKQTNGAGVEQVIAKISKDLPYRGPLNRRAEFESGEVTLTVPLVLPPGRYHVDAALVDIEAGTASVRKVALVVDVSKLQDRAVTTDLVWVRSVHTRQAGEEANSINPLDTPYGLITPQVTATFSVSQVPAFFFKIYGASPAAAARMVLSKNGAPVKTVVLTLPPSGSDGSISFLGQLPITGLAPGEYDVSLVVKSGATEVSRLARFVLVN